MKKKRKNDGFSLTEVLLSVGILTVGLIFVAGVFPVAIHFATIGTERTIAAVVADEAFAKIRLYGVDFTSSAWPADPTIECVDFNDVQAVPLSLNEFAYPSTGIDISEKKFYWSALCRRKDTYTSLVQVTVFVYRKTGAGKRYWEREPLLPYQPVPTAAVPMPIKVAVWPGIKSNELVIQDSDSSDDPVDETTFINDGYTIVDDQTGQVFRVLERYASPGDTILLEKNWPWSLMPVPRLVWVVPPPANGGRNPCIAIYQIPEMQLPDMQL